MGFFDKIKEGLAKTKGSIMDKIDAAVFSLSASPEELYEELEEILIMSDIGFATSTDIIEKLRERVKEERAKEPEEIRGLLKEIVAGMLAGECELKLTSKPSVILVIGVNGVGKTTTIAKLSQRLKDEGKKVVLGAADTFRAAAIDQLAVWAGRVGADIVKHEPGADPAAVVFDTLQAAKARGCDVAIVDTAGRLHNKKNLMDELHKIFRVIRRELPDNDLEVLLVLDGTTGQNAVSQAKQFKEAADITGVVLTKLDGTAKGGIVIAIKNELDIPVKFVGVGEKADDLLPFDPAAFAEALFEK